MFQHLLLQRLVIAALPTGECDLATVYRSLHLLEGMGIVKRFDLGDGVARFELLLSDPDPFRREVLSAISTVRAELKLPPANAELV